MELRIRKSRTSRADVMTPDGYVAQQPGPPSFQLAAVAVAGADQTPNAGVAGSTPGQRTKGQFRRLVI